MFYSKKLSFSKQVVYWSLVVVIGVALGLALQFVRAWTEPPADVTPPEGNVVAPVTTSGNTQIKWGSLFVNGNLWQTGQQLVSNVGLWVGGGNLKLMIFASTAIRLSV